MIALVLSAVCLVCNTIAPFPPPQPVIPAPVVDKVTLTPPHGIPEVFIPPPKGGPTTAPAPGLCEIPQPTYHIWIGCDAAPSWIGMVREAKQRYGVDIYPLAESDAGWRSYQTQADLYAEYLNGGDLAAAPGNSRHESGHAVDLANSSTQGPIVDQIGSKWGWTRDVIGDYPHCDWYG